MLTSPIIQSFAMFVFLSSPPYDHKTFNTLYIIKSVSAWILLNKFASSKIMLAH